MLMFSKILDEIEASIDMEVYDTKKLLEQKYNQTEQQELISEYKTEVFKVIDDCGSYIRFKSLGNSYLYNKYKAETEYFKLNIEDNSKNLYDFAETSLEALSYKVLYSCQARFDALAKQIVELVDVSKYSQTFIDIQNIYHQVTDSTNTEDRTIMEYNVGSSENTDNMVSLSGNYAVGELAEV